MFSNQFSNPSSGLQFPAMAGLSSTGQQAAVSQGTGNPAMFSATEQGTIFNNQTGATQSPGMFGQGGYAQMGISAIGTLGSLWNSFQQSKLAKKSLQFQEKTFETNLGNQTKTYNTELEDRIRTRYAAEGRDSGAADSYIAKNKL
jgi:hypothetical protein